MPPAVPEVVRSLIIGNQTVAYQLRRSQRRTIGLAIDQRGLRVGAPSRARLDDIEALIRQHGQWVLDKLAAWQERAAPLTQEITDGTVIPLLGEPVSIAMTTLGRARWQFGPNVLYLRPGTTANAAQLLEAALRDKARGIFAERLATHAPRLGVAVPPLRLSSARTRWGSCSHHGGISLNWRLVFMPLAVVDYVVAHELAHLKESEHNKAFYQLCEHLAPGYAQLEFDARVWLIWRESA